MISFAEHISLCCERCGRDVLTEHSSAATILGDYDADGQLEYVRLFCARPCVGEFRKSRDVTDVYWDVDSLRESEYYLQTWCALANHLMQRRIQTAAYEKFRDMLIVIAPFVRVGHDETPYDRLRDATFLFSRA